MSGNNIDVDRMTLKRLSDLAFSMTDDDKNEITDDVYNIIKYSTDIEEISEKILLLFQKKLKDRNDIFVKSLSNPVAVLKPKKPIFYRIE